MYYCRTVRVDDYKISFLVFESRKAIAVFLVILQPTPRITPYVEALALDGTRDSVRGLASVGV